MYVFYIYIFVRYVVIYDDLLRKHLLSRDQNAMCQKKRKKRNREQVEQQLRESFQILISRTYTLPANCNITKKQKEKKILRTGMNCSVYYIEIACAH